MCAANRTNLELKHNLHINTVDGLVTANRTNLELKHFYSNKTCRQANCQSDQSGIETISRKS